MRMAVSIPQDIFLAAFIVIGILERNMRTGSFNYIPFLFAPCHTLFQVGGLRSEVKTKILRSKDFYL